MNRAQTLAAIEGATSIAAIIAALRELSENDPLAGRLIPSALAEADEVADLALELTRLRTRLPHGDPDLMGLETLYARASVRISELLDPEGWRAYQARSGRRPPPRHTSIR
jgi:hypothetical protein